MRVMIIPEDPTLDQFILKPVIEAALYQDQLPAPWQEMRKECHPKEAFFNPLVEQLGLQNDVGRGRKQMIKSLTGRYSRLLQLCPEIAELRERIRQKLE